MLLEHLLILAEGTLQKMIVEITINWLPQFRKSIVFETELTKKMFILTIIFYSVSVVSAITSCFLGF